MSVLIQGSQLRTIDLGMGPLSKASGSAPGTVSAFTVAGGEVLITGLWVKVTTSSTTDGGTISVNLVPTAGNTVTLVTATDVGTTDSVAGSIIGLDRANSTITKFLLGGRVDLNAVVTTGVINFVGASSVNGAFTVYVTWIPLTTGATLVAN